MSNKYAREVWERFDRRFARDSENMSYTEWVCEHTTLRGLPFSIRDYEFQRKILDDMHPNLSVKKCSQIGLALDLDTPLPTLTGWTTMGEVKVGDRLFDEQGQPCTVTYTSPIYTDRTCYRITFDDGTNIIADADHRWYVETEKPFRGGEFFRGRGRPPAAMGFSRTGIVKTSFIAENFKNDIRNTFAVPNTSPIQLPSADLPIDPYVLGVWLGDGNKHANAITAHKDDEAYYRAKFEAVGFVCRSSSQREDTVQFTFNFPEGGVCTALVELNLLKNEKFIPAQYLRGSVEQRQALLAGLIDTDGSISNQNGRVCFYNTSRQLISDVEELVSSLGYKFRTRWRMNAPSTMKNGHVITPKLPCAEIGWTMYADDGVRFLPRKHSKLRTRELCRGSESLRRRITNVELVETRPVRCLTVDSESHLFLAGRGMTPTHNTEVQIRKALAFVKRNRGVSAIFTLPEEKLFKKISQTRIDPIIKRDRVFQMEDDEGSVRSLSIKQFGQSFLYVTGCTEGDATSTSADALFKDEVDLSPQDRLVLFNSRLQNSRHKISQGFSTPSFPGYGIDADFQISDQHEYMVKCGSCGHHNSPRFTRDFVHVPGLPDHIGDLIEIDVTMIDEIDPLGAYVKCEKCHTALDLGDPSLREWVAAYPSRSARGYMCTPFVTDRLPPSYIIDQLMKYKQRQYLRGFKNTVLGETHNDGSIQLGAPAIRACFTNQASIPDIGRDRPVALGIDMGQVCHLVIGDVATKAILSFEPIAVDKLEERVKWLLANLNIVCGGIDRHPYTPTANAIRDMSDGKIVPIEYAAKGPQFAMSWEIDDNDALSHVRANRTNLLDEVAMVVRNRMISFSGYNQWTEVIVEHLQGMWRDEQPETPATWNKLHGRDHFFHAIGYYLASMRIVELEETLSNSKSRHHVVTSVATFPASQDILGKRNSPSSFGATLGFNR